ncbi:MAG: hypothetical protein JSS91_12330 [Bacteroidetes bacterium]|nr:hypothetical protein [Bacteroidota bacterium]
MKKFFKNFRELKFTLNFLVILAISVIFFAFNAGEKSTEVKQNTMSPEWTGFYDVPLQDDYTPGIPFDGGPGITRTVQDIMNEEAMLPADHYSKPRPRTNPEFEIERPEKQVNPGAPDVAQWPPRTSEEVTREQTQTDNPQTVSTSIAGPNLASSGYLPPDSQGDVGPDQVLIAINGRIRVYDKNGNLGGLNADLDVFFSSVDGGTGVSDPHVRYDRLSARWFIVAISLQSSNNRVVIARSSGPSITGSGSFTFFQFAENLPGTILGFADYPTLGVDKNALYIGMNMFNAAGTSFLGTNGYVINKANLISGTLTATGFTLLTSGAGIYTPQGVDNDDPNATEGYFVGVDNASFSLLVVKRVINPGGTPSISSNYNITVPTTVYPETARQTGSTKRLDALDDRLFAAEIHKNKITGAQTLWTAHNIEVGADGVANTSGNRDACRWYELTNMTSTPSLLQSGTLYDPAASNPRYFFIPSVAMSGQGHMALGCSSAGLIYHPEVQVAGRLRTDPSGSIQAITLGQSSSTVYGVQSGTTQRWGDYSQTVVDPTDDMTMWTFQEYCDATNSYAVRGIKLLAPPPATPSASNIVNIPAGQSSVNIIITGTSTSGSEFFDPGADAGGPGFANHISASISGSVTVNSITFDSPTQITLNISTVGSPAGNKNITVTNPDGQFRTGNNLINVTAPATLNLTALIQGFYDASTNLMVRDTVTVTLRNNFSPYAVVDQGKAYLSTSGTGSIQFNNAVNGVNYYMQLNQRNLIETWSKSPGQSFSASVLTYNFTTASAQAFGSNQIQVDDSPVRFAAYNADVNQDGIVDIADGGLIDNDIFNVATGYIPTDANGDGIADISDATIADNNGFNIVTSVTP